MASNSMQLVSMIMIALTLPALATSVLRESRTTVQRFALRGCASTIGPLLWWIWVGFCLLVHPFVRCFASKFYVRPLLKQQEKATPIQQLGTLNFRPKASIGVHDSQGSWVLSFALCSWSSILSLCGSHFGSTSWWPCQRGQRVGRSWRRPRAWDALAL